MCIGDLRIASTMHLATNHATSHACNHQCSDAKHQHTQTGEAQGFASSWLMCSGKFDAAHIIKHKLLYLAVSVVFDASIQLVEQLV